MWQYVSCNRRIAKMAGLTFSKLFRVLGGAEALAERINALMDRCDAREVQRPLTTSVIYAWSPSSFPMIWRQWTLAAALDAGLTEDQAMALCPELKPALALARLIVWRTSQPRMPEAAE
jgi:hypothetical protein